MTNKLSDKDKKDWQKFLDSSEKLHNKDVDQVNNQIISERTIDLHGYTLEEANKKISEFIENCYVNKIKKINVITGKGMRSKNLDDPYQSKDLSILKEPDNSLIKQYKALLKTENVDLEFTEDGIDTIATIASEVNTTVENIGARRLHTIIERVLDEISFTATDRAGEKISIDSEYIKKNIGELVKDADLSKFIL